jgi:anti-anti-sigma factor
MLTVTSEIIAEAVILHCRGRLVRGEEPALLCAAVPHYGRDIMLDLVAVSSIDAAGIGALASLQAAGIYLRLMNPNESVSPILRLTGMDTILEIGQAESLKDNKPARGLRLGQLSTEPHRIQN